jgi:two-component system response regulator
MAAGYGRTRRLSAGLPFTSRSPKEETQTVNDAPIEILLVEGNANDIKLALYAFEKHNLANRIHVVRDGEEALEYVFGTGRYEGRQIESGPKLILLDLKLPLVDGLEVLERIKGDPRTHAMPVVMLTSSREECDIVESYKLGVNSYIVKPVDFDQFIDAVRQLGFYWLLLNQGATQRA